MKYFGTDGIRGIANEDLTPEFALKVGKASGLFFRGDIIVSKDPRLSSDALEAALISGILSTGVNVYTTGILPTPALSLLLKTNGKSGGGMISASHNPIEYNGIKFFNKNGIKLSEKEEEEIEKLIDKEIKVNKNFGKNFSFLEGKDIYIREVIKNNKLNLKGIKIALDLAYGATTVVAPHIFSSLNADLILFNEIPDGKRINVNCGSTNIDFLTKMKKERNFDIGFSYDGDGDRVIAVDDKGEVVDGDMIMFILAKHLKLNSIVITVMSNFGLKVLLNKYKIKYFETPVGDRNVLYKMLEEDVPIGGEQSGHIIFLPQSNTGDGIITSLLLLRVILNENKPLSELKKEFIKYPQILRNVEVQDKNLIMNDEEFKKEVMLWNERLNGKGRVLVRPSGTENLIRIMVEGEKEEEIKEIAISLENSLKKRLAQISKSG